MRKTFLLFTVAAITMCMSHRTAAQNIYTFAGIAGTAGYGGDDSTATLARLSGPSGIVTTAAGVVYFSDSRNNVVRSISTTGVITTIAGNGTVGYSGDGGPASAAQLRIPEGLALDAAGNIYIADSRNHAVRMINASGIITTIAGTGVLGYSGDGGPATAAQLHTPTGVAVDAAGNVYIADLRNQVIRRITASGTITTVAGNNTIGYTGDAGPATAAQLNLPSDIAITASGSMYIADSRNNVVRLVSPAGVISTFAGNGTAGYSGDGGPASAAKLFVPNGVKTDASGNVFVADSNNTVRMISTTGIISTYAGTGVAGYSGDGGPATSAKMTFPDGIAIDASHNLYISTFGNSVIRRVGAAVAGISITSNVGDTACIGHATSFTATVVADATPHYQWQQNGINAGTDAATFTPATLAVGDVIHCYLLATGGGTELAVSNNLRIDSLYRTGIITGPNNFCPGSPANMRDLGGRPGGTWVSSNTAVATIAPTGNLNPVASGTATIYYVLSNACGRDTASYVITVSPATIGAITGPAHVCEGATVTYADTTAGDQWRSRPFASGRIDSLTGVFTAGFTTGSVIIIYGRNGCFVTDTITIDSMPVNAPITGPALVDSSMSITLANANPGGTWSSSNAGIAAVDPITGVVTGIASGTATITYTIMAPGGCSADTTYTVTVNKTAGIHDLHTGRSFSIYPNPAGSSLSIFTANPVSSTGKVVITDVSGRMVYSAEITISNAPALIDISSLKTGFYLITIKSAGGTYTDKLIVE